MRITPVDSVSEWVRGPNAHQSPVPYLIVADK